MRLEPVKAVLDHPGPFVTVHAEVGRGTADAVSQRDARWTTIRHELEHAGVSEALVARIGEKLLDNTHLPGDVRRTIVGADDEVVLDDVQPGHSAWPEVTEVACLPELSAWLAAGDAACSFVLVNADRIGADISLHSAVAEPASVERSVDGESFYVTKVAEGDWAQKQFQQSAENAWRENAEMVAEEVLSIARRHRPEVALVAGETRARAEVLRALEDAHGELPPVREITSGGRAEGASTEALWTEIEQVIAGVVHERDAAFTARLDQARGQGEGAATGLDDVVAALAQSKVEHLAVDLAAMSDRTIATDRLTGVPLPARAQAEAELPADRALVAAAALTGAQLTLLPSSMSHGGGVAALLRWD